MKGVNVEIKARCGDPARVRRVLAARKAEFRGTDRQIDTYFNVSRGRLKLREGKIENCLIFYERKDRKGPKVCDVRLVPTDAESAPALKALLAAALGVRCVVDKRREIYFIGNVKFHIDRVRGLGTFVEIEARDRGGDTASGNCGRGAPNMQGSSASRTKTSSPDPTPKW